MNGPSFGPLVDRATLDRLARELADRDPSLGRILSALGPPPLWRRPATYATLVRIVLEQNVSGASAKSTYDRLLDACGGRVTAKAVLGDVGEAGLRQIGFSRQKAGYATGLARAVRDRRLPIGRLGRLTDDQVRETLTPFRGIGDWTVDIFLLMALRRPDVFPGGDLAVRKGMETLDGTDYSDRQAMRRRADRWRPYRSVACRMVWQFYLHGRRRGIGSPGSLSLAANQIDPLAGG